LPCLMVTGHLVGRSSAGTTMVFWSVLCLFCSVCLDRRT
jgi:hypothetical protein